MKKKRRHQANAFKREHGRSKTEISHPSKCGCNAKNQPDKKREIPRVEHFDFCDTPVGNDQYLASENID